MTFATTRTLVRVFVWPVTFRFLLRLTSGKGRTIPPRPVRASVLQISFDTIHSGCSDCARALLSACDAVVFFIASNAQRFEEMIRLAFVSDEMRRYMDVVNGQYGLTFTCSNFNCA